MIKNCHTNFWKRFNYFFICFGLILLGFVVGALLFRAGLTLTLHLQEGDLVNEVSEYLNTSLSNVKSKDIISLSIIIKVYNDIIAIAGNDSNSVMIGITLSAILGVIVVYGAFKGSIALVNYLNKRELRNNKTKHGFTSFIVKLIIGVIFSALLFILLHLWTWSALIVLIIYIFVDSFEEVAMIRYIYFSDQNLKDFIFSKTFIKIMNVFFIYQYSILILAGAFWFLSPFISLFAMVPLLAYSETNIEYTIIATYKDASLMA